MEFRSIEFIKDLENQIEKSYSLPIFKGYVAVNKRGVEKLIAQIYATLPSDLEAAKKYLQNSQANSKFENDEPSEGKILYENLQKLERIVKKAMNVASYVIVNIREIEDLLNNIQTSLPDEMVNTQSQSEE